MKTKISKTNRIIVSAHYVFGTICLLIALFTLTWWNAMFGAFAILLGKAWLAEESKYCDKDNDHEQRRD